MKSEFTVRFYGDWRTYLDALRKAGIVGFGEEKGSRADERGNELVESRSDPSDEDDPISARLTVKSVEELADVLAALRADTSGGYGWGVGYSAETEEAKVWSGLGCEGYYGEFLTCAEVRVDSKKLAEKMQGAMRSAVSTLEKALAPEEPDA